MTANGNQMQYLYTGMDILNEIRAQINGQNFVWTRELDTLNRPIKDVLPNGIEVRRTFTALSQLASINNYSPNSNLISGFAYQYDDVGKRTSKTESFVGTAPTGNVGVMSNTSNYSYDNLDRLTQSSSPRESFSYDVVGNRHFAAGTNYNAINQLLGDGWKYSFEYNLNGDMTKKTNLLTGQETNFVWNAESQLVAMQILDTGSVTKEIFFKYDGLGRRIERQVVDHGDNSKSYGRKFFYEGDMILEEQDLNGNLVARYMNGSEIDDPLLLVRPEGNFVFTKDGLGSIRELTKPDGTSIQKYRYSSYGMTTQELQENRPDKNLIENRYAYTGREIEDETGLYYYRARYYDPELGIFITEDPIGFEGQQINFYLYANQDPINFVDPSGNILVAPIILGGVLGGGLELGGQLLENGGNFQCIDWGKVGKEAVIGGALGGAGQLLARTKFIGSAIQRGLAGTKFGPGGAVNRGFLRVGVGTAGKGVIAPSSGGTRSMIRIGIGNSHVDLLDLGPRVLK